MGFEVRLLDMYKQNMGFKKAKLWASGLGGLCIILILGISIRPLPHLKLIGRVIFHLNTVRNHLSSPAVEFLF